jgi:hypothetical protein
MRTISPAFGDGGKVTVTIFELLKR